MHRWLIYATYGWLTLGGTLHFAIDVVSQYVRNKRPPGPETTLYFGLNTAFALGQILFGALGLWVARQAIELLGQGPAIALTLFAAACWLGFCFMFIEYKEPRFVVGLFALLAIAAAVTA